MTTVNDEQPDGTIEWHEVWQIREVLEKLEDLIGKREAAGIDDSASKGANSLDDYKVGMMNELEELIDALQGILAFVRMKMPSTMEYYVPEDWEEKPEE